MDSLTQIIDRIGQGDGRAQAELCALVYEELQQIARRIRRRAGARTLATADVVQECLGYFVANQRLGEMRNRRYFYRAAASQMWRLVLEYYRRRRSQIDGRLRRAELNPWLEELAESVEETYGVDLESLDFALHKLRADRPRQCEIVHLKCFVGMANDQVAEALEISVDTVKRDWKIARARLALLLRQVAETKQPGAAPS